MPAETRTLFAYTDQNIEWTIDNKKTKDGWYRLNVNVKDKEGDVLLRVDGFRVDATLMNIKPPVAGTRYGSFPFCEIQRDYECSILKWLKANRNILDDIR